MKPYLILPFLLLAMVLCCFGNRPASSASSGSTGSAAEIERSGKNAPDPRQFDVRLTGYRYPYEVEYFEFESQRMTHEMAYMDVRPESPNGKTILLLHGKNFSGAYWANTIAPLVEQGYRVVAPDQLGFGKSTKPDNYQFSFHALASQTLALLQSINVNRVAVVGHSMGGMLATRFALMFPDRTTELVLVNPIGLEDWKRKVPYRTVDAWYKRELQKTPGKIKAYMTSSYFDGKWDEAYAPLVELQSGWTRDPDYPRIAWVSALTYDMIFTQPVVYEFGQIRVPTLLIIGVRDRTALGKNLVPDKVAATMGLYDELGKKAAKAIPKSKLVELEGIGHIPQYEAFDAYFSALSGFLKGADN